MVNQAIIKEIINDMAEHLKTDKAWDTFEINGVVFQIFPKSKKDNTPDKIVLATNPIKDGKTVFRKAKWYFDWESFDLHAKLIADIHKKAIFLMKCAEKVNPKRTTKVSSKNTKTHTYNLD